MSQEYQSVDLVGDETVRHFTGAVLIAALTAVLAQFSIPLPSGTPFSLQPFGMFFAGLVLGPLWGGFAWALYLLVGIAGAPVFANAGSGAGYILGGPTGGFLIGFLLGTVAAGAIIHRGVQPRDLSTVSVPVQAAGLFAAIVVVYLVGVPWFASIQGLPIERALGALSPLIPLDLVKLAIAIGIVEGGYLVRQ